MDRVSDKDVEAALVTPLENIGYSWDLDALHDAVEACHGYPFMIQLVGLWSFRSAEGTTIDRSAATEGIAKARRKLGQLVHEPALAELSDVDRSFLLFMAQDDGPSKLSDIASRLKQTPQYTSNYKKRLIDAELIVAPPGTTGIVDFALPYLREYLREHAAHLIARYR